MSPKRNKPFQNHIIEVGESLDSQLNACCVVKLVIIWSLRIGAISETSWEGLVQSLRARQSHKVVWAFPMYPVFPRLRHGRDLVFDLTKPAKASAGNVILANASKLIGLIEKPTGHDLRRGAARDLAHIPVMLPGTNHEAARSILGRSVAAMDSGLTAHYVGKPGVDSWALRLEHSGSKNPGLSHKLHFAGKPDESPARTLGDIDNYCDERGWDKFVRKNRTRASKALAKNAHAIWTAEQERLLDSPGPSNSVQVIEDSPQRDPCNPQDIVLGALLDESTDDDSEEDSFALSDSTGNALFGSELDEMLSDAQDSSILNDNASSAECSVITQDAKTFVDFFSSINTIELDDIRSFRTNTENSRTINDVSSSKDAPERFRHRCLNAEFGCQKTFVQKHSRDHHSASCNLVSFAAAERERDMLPHVCDHDGCGKRFDKTGRLEQHRMESHLTPRKCSKVGCESEVFQTYGVLRQHHEHMHLGFQPGGVPCTHVHIRKYLSLVFIVAQTLAHPTHNRMGGGRIREGFLRRKLSWADLLGSMSRTLI